MGRAQHFYSKLKEGLKEGFFAQEMVLFYLGRFA
jgi:hypothetical protein